MRPELFGVSRRWPSKRTRETTGQACVNSGIFHCLPFNSSALYYHQTPTRRYGHASTLPRSLLITGHRNMHSRRLWNGMFDRHRAEITVMQFTGHSLPVHHFVTAPWDFYLVPYCQPSCILQLSWEMLSCEKWSRWPPLSSKTWQILGYVATVVE